MWYNGDRQALSYEVPLAKIHIERDRFLKLVRFTHKIVIEVIRNTEGSDCHRVLSIATFRRSNAYFLPTIFPVSPPQCPPKTEVEM